MALFTKPDGFAKHIGGIECRDGYWAYSGSQHAYASGSGSRHTFTLGDGRVLCADGDWAVFKSQVEAGNWEFALTYDEDTRSRGFYYMSLGGRWLCVDGYGALNFKNEGSYVYYEYGH